MKVKIKFMFICFIASFLSLYSMYYCTPNKYENEAGRSISKPDSIHLTCYETPKYFIVGREADKRLGTDFLIKYKSQPDDKYKCEYSIGNNDFEILNEWAEYYAGIKGDYLILDSSTGPGPTGLTIWGLNQRKKVFEGSWSDAEDSDDNHLVYWLETDQATEKNCPELKKWESQGLGGAIETKVILDLATMNITKTKETRCSPRQ